MNIWHDISDSRITPEIFDAVVEISSGSKNKYELDKTTGLLRLDRVLYTSTHYPANYGFIPRTFADDGDPLDVLILSQVRLDPMVLVQCYPIGVMRMMDQDEIDDKIIAVPVDDPNYNNYKDIKDLSKHVASEMAHFFEVYKSLEHKITATSEVMGKDEAQKIIQEAINRYQIHFCGKRDPEVVKKKRKIIADKLKNIVEKSEVDL